jgi:hypothetical protein
VKIIVMRRGKSGIVSLSKLWSTCDVEKPTEPYTSECAWEDGMLVFKLSHLVNGKE